MLKNLGFTMQRSTPTKGIRTISCAAAGLVLASSSMIGPAHAQGNVASICRSVNEAYAAAVKGGNPANVVALFAADGEWNAPQGIFKGSKALMAYVSAFVKPGDDHLDKQVSERLLGDVALCSGDFTFTFASGGPVSGVKGHYTKVLSRSGGNWKITELTTNFAPPPMPANTQAQAH